jgi:hypothetical protein
MLLMDRKNVDQFMLQTPRRFLRHASLTPAVLAVALLAACVDPATGPTGG